MVFRKPPAAARDRIADVTVVALALLAGAGILYAMRDRVAPGSAWWWVDAIGGIGCALLLPARRQWPLLVLSAISLVEVVTATPSLASAIALFAVAVRCRLRYAVGFALVSMITSTVHDALRGLPQTLDSVLRSLVLVLVVSVAIIACGVAVRSRRALLASLVERAERAEAEQVLRAENIRQAERTRIAREMHDVLAHRIALLNMHAGALAHRGDAGPAETAQAAEVIRGAAREAMQDLRVLLGVLRNPNSTEDAGADDAAPQPRLTNLDSLLTDLRSAGMDIDARIEVADVAGVPELAARTLYRVAQEALTNAAKHAAAAPVTLWLSGKPGDGVLLEVTNPIDRGNGQESNGVGGAGKGLVGITERINLAGGVVLHCGPDTGSAESGRTVPRQHFRVAVRLPWAR